MREIWLPIVGYGDCYSISSLGRVMRTKPRNIKRGGANGRPSRAKPFTPSECRAFVNRGGYPQVRIGPTGHQVTVCVHRLVAAAFIPNTKGLREVNHIDGHKANNSASNLEWSTRQANLKHAVKTGLLKIARGQRSPRALLTDTQVIAIRADRRTAVEIAAEYGTCAGNVYAIRQRRAWKHLL